MNLSWIPFVGGDDADVPADDVEFDASYDGSADALSNPIDRHRQLVAPESIEERPNTVATGDVWTRALWISGYPDRPMDGFLESLYATDDTRNTDISIHLDPRDTEATLDELENQIEDLEADTEYLAERRRAGARGVKKDLDDYRELYDLLRNTPTRAFDTVMYLTTRAPSEETLDIEPVMWTVRQAPVHLTPVTPRWSQVDALVSGSPIGLDRLNETLDTRTPMLAGAVGAMFPFVSGVFAEEGIEYGSYALNESPLILDRFNRPTGYCMMVIGKLGTGKSFSTKLQLLRRAMFDPETLIVMLDPMDGFRAVSDVLGGERITVGGMRGLNPLEIKPTPPTILEQVQDIDPWAKQISWVISFFETFFAEIADNPLGDRTQTLRRAVQETYERAGITRDPATHDNPSPTVTSLITVLEDLLEEPGTFGYTTAGERDRVAADAQSLLTDLRPSFRPGGEFANLARETEFDLDSNVIYLDLLQEEGVSGRTETSLMMKVLFNAVYERAKQTSKRVVFVIDEAHYLMDDASSLDFLETAVRHSRHYDLSIQFVTQTGGEFSLTPEARTIADLCSLVLIHRVSEDAEKLAKWFDLSEREAAWVRSAKAGNERNGYSEALLGVDEEGWFPIRVRPNDLELELLT